MAHPIIIAPPLAILPLAFPISAREISELIVFRLPTLTDGPLPPVCAIPGRPDGMLPILLLAVPPRLPDPEMNATVRTQEQLEELLVPILKLTAAPSPVFPTRLQQAEDRAEELIRSE